MNNQNLNYDQVVLQINMMADKLWKGLDEIMQGIQVGKMFTSKEISILYRFKIISQIYSICQTKNDSYGPQFYQKFLSINTDFLKKKVLNNLSNKNQLELLCEFVKYWECYQRHVKVLIVFFSYLDRQYVQLNGVPDLSSMALSMFKQQVYERKYNDIFSAFGEEMQKDRNGFETNHHILSKVCQIMVSLDVQRNNDKRNTKECLKEFQSMIHAQSEKYYFEKFQGWSELSCSDYLRRTAEFWDLEQKRLDRCFEGCPQLIDLINRSFCDKLIGKYKQQLLDSPLGIDHILKNDQFENFRLICKLYQKLDDNFDQIRTRFRDFVSGKGKEIIQQKGEEILKSGGIQELQHDPQLIHSLFEFHDRQLTFVQQYCLNNSFFHYMLRDAFESFVNLTIGDYGVAEYLAVYADKLLSKGQRIKTSEDDINYKLDRIVVLFGFLQDKDLFIQVYQNQLSKRLLTEQSQNLEDEKLIISKIKQNCGSIVTTQIEEMLNDIQENAHLNQDFQSSQCHTQDFPFTILVKVLQATSWPKYKEFNDIQLLPSFHLAKSQFQDFYKKYKKGNEFRQLKWINSLSSLVINIHLDNKKYECTLSMYQAQILFMYSNQDGPLTYEAIRQHLQMDDSNLTKNLSALSYFKLLEKEPKEGKINQQDTFSFNLNYNEKRLKFSLPFVFAEEQFKRESMDQEREIAVEACIVKIMKARKSMHYIDLIKQIQELLTTFQPTISSIKLRIEKLIQLEYLARDPNNINQLQYIS